MKRENREIMRRHFIDTHIAGFAFWEGCTVLPQLQIGERLNLVREEDNRFDPYAVAVYYSNTKLGYIPRNENHELSKFLEMGHDDLFEVRVNRISPEMLPEDQVGIVIFIVRREKQARGVARND